MALMVSLLMIDSMHFVFARLLFPHIEPGLGAFYVISFAALEVGLLGLVLGRLRLAPLLRLWPAFVAIGLCVAASTNLNYAAMEFIDPGVAAMVSRMAVLFSLGLGMLWLGERFNLVQGAGALLALIGLAVISFQPGDYFGLGTLMVLASTFLYALHTALTKRYTGEVDLISFFFCRLLLTAAILALATGVRGSFALPGAQALPFIILVATVDIVISRFSLLLGASPARYERLHRRPGGQPGGGDSLVALPVRRLSQRSAASRRCRYPCRRRPRHRCARFAATATAERCNSLK